MVSELIGRSGISHTVNSHSLLKFFCRYLAIRSMFSDDNIRTFFSVCHAFLACLEHVGRLALSVQQLR